VKEITRKRKRYKCDDYIKMDIRVIMPSSVDGSDLDYERDQWRALLNIAVKLGFDKNFRIFLKS
jgi:hypothetical protein